MHLPATIRTSRKEEYKVDLFRIDLTTKIEGRIVGTIEAYIYDPEPLFDPSEDHDDLIKVLDIVSQGACDTAIQFQEAILTDILEGEDRSRGFILIERLKVDRAYRGKRLGHALIDALSERTGSNWHVGLKAFPLENGDPSKIDGLAAYYMSHAATSFKKLDDGVLIGRWPAAQNATCTRSRPSYTRYHN